MLETAMAIAIAFRIDPIAVLDSGWFEWRIRNAAYQKYVEHLPPPPQK